MADASTRAEDRVARVATERRATLPTAFDAAFKKLDKNGDGKIAFEELNEWFHAAAKNRNLLKE